LKAFVGRKGFKGDIRIGFRVIMGEGGLSVVGMGVEEMEMVKGSTTRRLK